MLGINNGCIYTSEMNGDHICVSRNKGGCTYICWGSTLAAHDCWRSMVAAHV